jgi:hypothetical protein
LDVQLPISMMMDDTNNSPAVHTENSNFLQIFENEQGEKLNLEEVIEFSPITDELREYVAVEDREIDHPKDERRDTLNRIDQQKLMTLVRNRETIWNQGLPREHKSRIRRELAWLQIKKAFEDEFSIPDLKLKWKRLKDRYVKYAAKSTIPVKTKDSYGVESVVMQDITENDFMISMSFLSGSRIHLGMIFYLNLLLLAIFLRFSLR